jgi:hypothetical protein
MTILRNPIRTVIRGPIRAPMQSAYGGSNGLSVSAPGSLTFAVGDQPFTLDGANAISFADSATDGSGNYTLTMTLAQTAETPIIDFDNTAYAAVTENSGGDGTGAIDVTGTLAQINALFSGTEPDIDDYATGFGSIAITLSHTDGRSVSRTISVTISSGAFAHSLDFSDSRNSMYL